MQVKKLLSLIFLCYFSAVFPAFGQQSFSQPELQYADLADLSLAAPLIVRVEIKKTIKIKPTQYQSDISAMGFGNIPTQRLYVEAKVTTLIRGQGGIPEMIRYVVDVPLDARGKVPKLKKKAFLLFSLKNLEKEGEIQLVAPDAQISWNQNLEDRVRSVVRQVVTESVPPKISGVDSAFHVAGNILGEGETQIFLDTNEDTNVAITVLRRPGQTKLWAVSLTELIDDAALPPQPNSLLWYRLACELPSRIPASALGDNDNRQRRAVISDYEFVRRQLGSCNRTRTIRVR